MNVLLGFEPMADLFDEFSAIPMDQLKQKIVDDIRMTRLAGVPDYRLQIELEPQDGSDILIRQIDPEKALGTQTYGSVDDYYDSMEATLHLPSESEILAGLRRKHYPRQMVPVEG